MLGLDALLGDLIDWGMKCAETRAIYTLTDSFAPGRTFEYEGCITSLTVADDAHPGDDYTVVISGNYANAVYVVYSKELVREFSNNRAVCEFLRDRFTGKEGTYSTPRTLEAWLVLLRGFIEYDGISTKLLPCTGQLEAALEIPLPNGTATATMSSNGYFIVATPKRVQVFHTALAAKEAVVSELRREERVKC